MDSFASKFHKRLKEKHKIETIVYARISSVGFGSQAFDTDAADRWGRKVTMNQDDQFGEWDGDYHRQHSKLKFYWDNGKQKRDWAY